MLLTFSSIHSFISPCKVNVNNWPISLFYIFDHVISHGILIISWGTRIPKDFHSAKFHPALGILAIAIANLTFFPYTLLTQAFYPHPPSLPCLAPQPTPNFSVVRIYCILLVLRLLQKRSYSAQFFMTETVNWSESEGFGVVLSSCMLCANIMLWPVSCVCRLPFTRSLKMSKIWKISSTQFVKISREKSKIWLVQY